MACDTKCCYIGNGLVYIQRLPDFCPTTVTPNPYPLLPVGNVTELNLSFETTEETVPNTTNGSFGNYCSLTRIDQVNLQMNMTCFKTKNMELALAGQATEVTAGSVVDEVHIVQQECEFVITDHMIDQTGTITVTGTGGAPVYTVGTDYIVRPDGIYIPEGSAIATVPGTDIEISYDYIDYEDISIASTGFSDYLVHVSGINAATNTYFSETFYRVKFGPGDTIALINTTFGSLNVTGELLPDECHLDSLGNPKRASFKFPL
ncbi:MAG: hypothetical protein KDH96_00120 [Candidatus Riesia sp.]|nr:hypothetical protein [Candidatus Riesia sp.]